MTDGPLIPWQRFWCPLGSVIHCGDEGDGFLTDPEDKYGRLANPTVSPLASLLPEWGLVVLCGEPGIGKSTELAGIRTMLEKQCDECDERLLWLVFRDVADAADFRQKTVGGLIWNAWRTGTTRLTLVVDGVDEGLLRVPNFVNDLAALLKSEPVNRLRVILACRTAEWPTEMGRALLSLWPEGMRAPFFELCPLRQKDVELAALARNADAGKFLEAVWRRGVVGLASRPVTLFFLLREFRGGELPATHRELYERGTQSLARETNPVRLELLRALRRTEHRCSDADRMHAAERLATLLLLTGRSAIWLTGASFDEIPPRDLTLDAAADADGRVSVEAMQEALESALFTSLGEKRFGFAHQTFAECIAARHLGKLPLVQLRRLLCQRDIRGEHVIPQLAELAGWTAGYHSEFCDHLLRIEPEMLLRSDVARMQGVFKVRLVAALLDGAEREQIFDGKGFGRFVDGLRHPNLPAQLAPFISDKRKNRIARRIAFTIAARCKLHELTDAALAVVYDMGDDPHLRDCAANALEGLISEDRLADLEPLAKGLITPDSDDSIKGHALRRLVPSHWKVRDALPYVTPHKNENFIGVYYVFLENEIAKHLEDADIVPTLRWLRANFACFDSLHPANNFALAAVAHAAKLLDDPAVLAALVELWIAQEDGLVALLSQDSLRAAFKSDRFARLRFVGGFLNHPDVKREHVYLLTHGGLLTDSSDLDWLLNEISHVATERRIAWATAIRRMTHDEILAAPCWDKLLARIDEIPELAVLYEWLRAWSFDEPCAVKAKADWLRQQEWKRRAEEQRLREQPKDYRTDIGKALADVEAGEFKAWFRLWDLLRKDSAITDWRGATDLTLYPSWAKLTDTEKAVCRRGAREYLVKRPEDGVEISPTFAAALAARCALSLLMESAEGDETLRRALAGPWLNALVIGRYSESGDMRERQFELLHSLNPHGCVSALLQDMATQLPVSFYPAVLRIAARCWTRQLSEKCAAFLDTLSSPAAVVLGIEEMASVCETDAAEYALKFLRACAPSGDVYPIGLCGALVTALLFAPAQSFFTVVEMMKDDEALQRSVWTAALEMQDNGRGHLLRALSEEELGCLYQNVQRVLPSKDDPPWDGGFVTAEMSARRIRDTILDILASKATESGCHELLRLAAAMPEQASHLRWVYRNAVTGVRRNLWIPPSPEAVKYVVTRPSARLLNCGEDLLELVEESLARLQKHLTERALPAVEDLWRWEGGGNARHHFRPKDEEALSDYVARWLADDIGASAGVVVGREVQPRRGLRTDVYVEAVAGQSDDAREKLTVVIEVKGCWHPEVRTALQTQLADDYLRSHGLRFGVYLVGWFVCPRWEGSVNNLAVSDLQKARSNVEAMAAEFAEGVSELRIVSTVLDCTF